MLNLSASVVVYRTPLAELQPLFQSVLASTVPVELDVVDNGGDSSLQDYCAKVGFNYINSGGNIGFGAAHNLSISRHLRTSRFHAVINPDVVFGPAALADLTEYLKDNPDVGQVQPRVLYPKGDVQYLTKLLPGPFLLIVRRFLPSFLDVLFREMEKRYELRDAPLDKVVDAPNLSGCFMVFRTEVLQKVGMFDERYFMYMEDIDITRRVAVVARTCCNPKVVVTHEFSRGSYKNWKLLAIHVRSAIAYFNKWGWFFDRERRDLNQSTLNRLKLTGPPRVLHVYKTFFPDSYGGIEQTVLEQCRGLLSVGVHVEVFTLSHNIKKVEVTSYQGIPVTRVPVVFEYASTPFSLRAFREFARIQKNFDLIHLHFPWPFGDLLALMFCGKQPIVVTYHSDIIKQKLLNLIYQPLKLLLFARAKAILATSPNYVATSKTLKKYSGKVRSIALGLDESYYPRPNKNRVAELRAKHGRFFCFIGVFRYYKGLRFLIDAAPLVDAKFLLVGDGPEMRYLRVHAASVGATNVVFLGAVDDQAKIDVLEASYGFVMPSQFRSEAFGLSLVEAAMHGKPLVSCEIGTGTSYVNLHNETGLVVEPFSGVAIASALTQLLDYPEQAAKFGKNARRRFEEHFSGRKMVLNYLEVYHRSHAMYLPSKTNRI